MMSLADEYQRMLERESKHWQLEFNEPKIPFHSSVTTKEVSSGKELGVQYWISNLVSPVLFKTTVQNTARQQSKSIFLEIGPHSTLAGPLRDSSEHIGLDLPYVSTLQRNVDSEHKFISAVGEIWQHGVDINWKHLAARGKVLTDLPPYAWDHGQSHWYEGQISREWRFRKFGHHRLLGLRVLETTDIAPWWRNALSLEEELWLYDHKLHNDVIFPFAGYCTMACEAFRQLSGKEAGYCLKNVVVRNAMRLDESKPVEIRTLLLPVKTRGHEMHNTYDFTISSRSGSQWILNCEGQVTERSAISKYQDKSRSFAGINPACMLPRKKQPEEASYVLPAEMPSSHWISALSRIGVNLGQSFQCLFTIKTSAGKHVATAKIKSQQLDERSHPGSPVLIQTCIIDACLQMALIASIKGLERNLSGLIVPTTMSEMTLGFTGEDMTASAWSDDDGQSFAVQCLAGDVVMLHLEGLKFQRVDNGKSALYQDYGAAELIWRPHFDFADHSTLLEGPTSSPKLVKLREEIALLCMADCVERLVGHEAVEPHMTKWRDWMGEIEQKSIQGSHPVLTNSKHFLPIDKQERRTLITEKFEVVSRIAPADSFTTAMKLIWENVEAIYTGRDTALNILTQGDLLTKIYNENSFDHSKFTQLLSHTNPTLRILEVGAGTGGTTQTFLEDLIDKLAEDKPRYSLYTFTDISDGFFAQAKDRFSYAPNMQYQKLDISKNPLEQDFESGTYDLILAANVVHATPVLGKSLNNLRMLLKEKGLLVLTELITVTSAWNYVFGTLPGWWLGAADGRPNEPFVKIHRWDRELRASGLSGAETVVHDAEEPFQYCAGIVTRATSASNPSETCREVYVLCADAKESLVGGLTDALTQAGHSPSILRLGKKLPSQDCDIVAILDPIKPFLENIAECTFSAFQFTLRQLKTQKMLWLTWPVQVSCQDPRAAQSLGLIRAIRAELDLPVFTLEIDPKEPKYFRLVLEVFEKMRKSVDNEKLLPDREFVVHDGQIMVGRYHQSDLKQRNLMLDDPAQGKAPRTNGITRWEESSTWDLEDTQDHIAPGCIEIQAIIHDNYDLDPVSLDCPTLDKDTDPRVMASCCAVVGTVLRAGSNCNDVAEVGSKVIALRPFGEIPSHAIIEADLVRKIPKDLSIDYDEIKPTPFVTAYRALVEIGQVAKHQSVLIHLAASVLGDAAIQICKNMEVEIFVTVTSEEEREYLVVNYGLLADHLYLADDEMLADHLLQDTKGRGTDLVLSSPIRDMPASSWCCVAAFGQLLDLGTGDLVSLHKSDLQAFMRNRSYCCVNIGRWILENPEDAGRCVLHTAEHMRMAMLIPFL